MGTRIHTLGAATTEHAATTHITQRTSLLCLSIHHVPCATSGSKAMVEKACVGEGKCDTLINTVKALGVDPCPSEHWDKRFLAVVKCA